MSEKMIIAYACDERYLPFLKVSMASVRRYNKNVEFAVLTGAPFNVPSATVYTFAPDSDKFKFKQKDRMGEGVYYKLYLPKLPYDQVLYIDCDIVCQRPLNALWNEECGFICATESHSYGKKQAAELGLAKYANTGVMLMNLKNLREMNFTQRCLDRLDKETPNQHDETIINLEFGDKIRFIDKKYNYCKDRIYADAMPESDAYLLHYIGAKQKIEMLRRDDFSNLADLKTLLKGKRVAIVGNSERILGQNLGKEIDTHDIVIRFNRGLPFEKIGFKTDIVFLACTLTPEELSTFGDAYTVKRSKLCKNECDFRVSNLDRIQLAQTITNAVKAHNCLATSAQASTGFIAINFALSCKCKSIDLYGFDFFKEPTYYNPAGYQTLHNGKAEEEKILEYEKCGLLAIK